MQADNTLCEVCSVFLVFKFDVANAQLSVRTVGLLLLLNRVSQNAVRPSKLAQATTRLTSIEVAGSYLDRDTNSLDRGFYWFSPVSLGKFRDSTFSLIAVASFIEH